SFLGQHAHRSDRFDARHDGVVELPYLRRLPQKMVREIMTPAGVRLIAVREHATALGAAPERRLGAHDAVTTARMKPSYPLLPTVWRPVADTRGSRDTSSTSRRTPRTLSSSLAASITLPLRTTLSTTITVPTLERRSDASK